MTQRQTDYTDARNNMVDSQIRPNRVTDPRVLDAMRSLPREQFVPPHLSAVAYIDEDLPLGGGRVLLEPLLTARLVQSARVKPGERVLMVAAGTGYGAAVMAACTTNVTALEEDDALMAIALRVLPRVAASVHLVNGRLAAGLPGEKLWDAIVIEGAVAAIPDTFAGQLSPHGRLVTIVRPAGAPTGRLVLAEPVATAAGHRLRSRELFDSATPLIPSLVPAPSFVF
jgi:protein-L-isoaspartate(D-aspartate) O-methyltransferase